MNFAPFSRFGLLTALSLLSVAAQAAGPAASQKELCAATEAQLRADFANLPQHERLGKWERNRYDQSNLYSSLATEVNGAMKQWSDLTPTLRAYVEGLYTNDTQIFFLNRDHVKSAQAALGDRAAVCPAGKIAKQFDFDNQYKTYCYSLDPYSERVTGSIGIISVPGVNGVYHHQTPLLSSIRYQDFSDRDVCYTVKDCQQQLARDLRAGWLLRDIKVNTPDLLARTEKEVRQYRLWHMGFDLSVQNGEQTVHAKIRLLDLIDSPLGFTGDELYQRENRKPEFQTEAQYLKAHLPVACKAGVR